MISPSSGDHWGADLDLLNLPCMPSGRQEFFQRMLRLRGDSWHWTPAHKRAFNKIWSHLERLERDGDSARREAPAAL
jgi:hypothetical protein